MTRIYHDGTYLQNNPTCHVEDSRWKAEQVIKMLHKNRLDPTTLCDVGCGAGEVLFHLQHDLDGQKSFCGYEISPQAFELCKTRQRPNLRFHLADPLERHDLRFDLVLVLDVIEHIEDCFGFLRRLKSASRTAYKLFHIPLDLSMYFILRGHLMSRRRTVGHLHYFTKETALATLKDSGYEILDFFYTASSLELPNQSWKARVLNVPRKWGFRFNRDLTVRVLGGYSLMVLAK